MNGRKIEGNDDDIPSQDTWQTIADYSSEVVAEIAKIVDSLGFAPEWKEVLARVLSQILRGGVVRLVGVVMRRSIARTVRLV